MAQLHVLPCPGSVTALALPCSTTVPCRLLQHYPSLPLPSLQTTAALLLVVVEPLPLKLDYSAAQLSLLRSTQLYLYCIFVALAQYLVSVPNCTIGNLLLSLLTCLAGVSVISGFVLP